MADNTSPEEQNNEAREEFPQKLRVHALARLLGLTSKEVLAHLGERWPALGIGLVALARRGPPGASR